MTIWGETLTFFILLYFYKILFTGGQEKGIKIKVVNILNILAVLFALLFCIAKSFFAQSNKLSNSPIAQLPVLIVKGNGCSAPQGIVTNGIMTIKKQKDGSAPW